MSSSTQNITDLNVSLVLDRRSFLTSAAIATGLVAARASWSFAADGAAEHIPEATNVSGIEMEWAADHIFGTYPPYAHPIPYGHQCAPPVSFDEGSFDPVLMI